MSNIKVLVVSFYFPPYPKVGGRRWAKFAKYLNRDGIDTHVLCVTFNQDKESPWNNDVAEYEEKVHRIRKEFTKPYYLQEHPENIVQKIKWKLSYWSDKRYKKNFKGNYNDPGLKYVDEIRRETERLIEEYDFETVIVTGGPFSVPYEISKLKNSFPKVKFVVDIRDMWTGGMKNQLLPFQLTSELNKERETYTQADIITTCSNYIIEDIKERMPELTTPIYMLNHAFDQEDFEPIDKNVLTGDASEKLKMVYAGTLYPGMEEEIKKLISFVSYLKENGFKPLVEFYTFTKDYEEIINDSDVKDHFIYQDIVSPLELSRVMSESAYILQLRPKSEEGWENFMSSKFYELFYYRKPILYFGPKSTVQEFLEDTNLGVWVDSYSNHPDFNIILSKLQNREVPDKSYDISQHEYQVEVNNLKEIIGF